MLCVICANLKNVNIIEELFFISTCTSYIKKNNRLPIKTGVFSGEKNAIFLEHGASCFNILLGRQQYPGAYEGKPYKKKDELSWDANSHV